VIGVEYPVAGKPAAFRAVNTEAFDVPGKGSVVIKFILKVDRPGSFEFEVPLYVNDPEYRQLPVKVRGVAE
jgi:hypothetical protein